MDVSTWPMYKANGWETKQPNKQAIPMRKYKSFRYVQIMFRKGVSFC